MNDVHLIKIYHVDYTCIESYTTVTLNDHLYTRPLSTGNR